MNKLKSEAPFLDPWGTPAMTSKEKNKNQPKNNPDIVFLFYFN